MNITSEEVAELELVFASGTHTPPPFNHTYQLRLQLPALQANYTLNYLHREDLTEDEILDEGFTENDDWSWEGKLNSAWLQSVQDMITKHSWPKHPAKADEEEPALLIRLRNASGNLLFEGVPADPEAWLYFGQELIQALYETAGREALWVMEFVDKTKQDVRFRLKMEARFSTRSLHLTRESEQGKAEKTLPWSELKRLMKVIYLPDYLPEEASEQLPKRSGKFLNTGEGFWFEFGSSLVEPSEKSKTLPQLEETLRNLLA